MILSLQVEAIIRNQLSNYMSLTFSNKFKFKTGPFKLKF
jgi:hypothetical protein